MNINPSYNKLLKAINNFDGSREAKANYSSASEDYFFNQDRDLSKRRAGIASEKNTETSESGDLKRLVEAAEGLQNAKARDIVLKEIQNTMNILKSKNDEFTPQAQAILDRKVEVGKPSTAKPEDNPYTKPMAIAKTRKKEAPKRLEEPEALKKLLNIIAEDAPNIKAIEEAASNYFSLGFRVPKDMPKLMQRVGYYFPPSGLGALSGSERVHPQNEDQQAVFKRTLDLKNIDIQNSIILAIAKGIEKLGFFESVLTNPDDATIEPLTKEFFEKAYKLTGDNRYGKYLSAWKRIPKATEELIGDSKPAGYIKDKHLLPALWNIPEVMRKIGHPFVPENGLPAYKALSKDENPEKVFERICSIIKKQKDASTKNSIILAIAKEIDEQGFFDSVILSDKEPMTKKFVEEAKELLAREPKEIKEDKDLKDATKPVVTHSAETLEASNGLFGLIESFIKGDSNASTEAIKQAVKDRFPSALWAKGQRRFFDNIFKKIENKEPNIRRTIILTIAGELDNQDFYEFASDLGVSIDPLTEAFFKEVDNLAPASIYGKYASIFESEKQKTRMAIASSEREISEAEVFNRRVTTVLAILLIIMITVVLGLYTNPNAMYDLWQFANSTGTASIPSNASSIASNISSIVSNITNATANITNITNITGNISIL